MKSAPKKSRLKQLLYKISSNKYFRISLVLTILVAIALSIYFSVAGHDDPVALRVVTGPIIGKVTTTTARILLEFSTETLMTVILTDPTGKQTKVTKTTKAFRPIPFAFESLQPNTTYTLSLDNSSLAIVESYFTTLSGESGKLNFGVISCNYREVQEAKKPEEDLWADVLAKIKSNQIQYLLHLGDQVYLDIGATSSYRGCLAILKETPQDEWESKRYELLEIIRNEYRLTWNLPTVRDTLAKVPSLMIFDDHEFVNNWAFSPEDNDPNLPYYFYGNLARQAYYEYERQLREDINFDDISLYTEEYYYEALNDIGFFFMEYRGIRSWDRAFSQRGNSHIGATQTKFLQQILDSDIDNSVNLTNFFLVSTLAIVEPSQEGYPGQEVTNDESWGYAYNNERGELFNTLREWKVANESREVTILGGDTHIGSYTDIMYDGTVVFHQIVSSSIASGLYTEASWEALGIPEETKPLVDSWSFKHQNLMNRHNYVIFLASKQEDEALVESYFVY